MPNTVYQCMYCGSIFDTLSQACECENNHVKAERILDQHINPDNYKEIPDLLVIKMSDGTMAEYVPKQSTDWKEKML